MPWARNKMIGMLHDKLMECESEKKRLPYGTHLYTHMLESPLVCVCGGRRRNIFYSPGGILLVSWYFPISFCSDSDMKNVPGLFFSLSMQKDKRIVSMHKS